jgi:small-conductance mechanosensitive channel
VDTREQSRPELVQQAAKVNARTRPWHVYIALALAIIAAGVSYAFGTKVKGGLFENGQLGDSVVAASAAGAFFVFATVTVLALARRARAALESVTGSVHHAALVRYAIVLAGAIVVIIITLVLLKVPISQLLAAGALAGIIVSIAAQQSLSNIFAGLVLVLSRPFRVGDTIWLRSGALGGQHEGTVTEIGITYMQLETGDDLMSLPNSQVLAAAVSRRPSAARQEGPDRPGQPLPPVAVEAAATGPVMGLIEPGRVEH